MKIQILFALTSFLFIAGTKSNAQSWSLTGNAGTNSGTNFIGTTDNVNFKIRTKNNVRLTVTAGGKIGIGTEVPVGKLHVKGNADISQLMIDAGTIQSNTNPLIKLRNNAGTDLMWIHSDDATNSFVGLNAGSVNNAGGGGLYNTFIGSGAGSSNTTGTYNTATGYLSLYSNTTGYFNTASGNYALYFNTTGYGNTACGVQALYFNTIGLNNTAIGYNALVYNTSGYANTASGVQALYSNTTGIENTASGYASLYNNSTGSYNTAWGNGSLYSNTIGSYNTASGYSSLNANTTGTENTALGYASLNSNTTGYDNTASGYQSLYSTTTGSRNTATGDASLYSTTTGNLNTASGVRSLYSNTTGSYNTASGMYTLYSNTTGFNNTASGYSAGEAYADGTYNTFLGYDTDVGAATLTNCVAIGGNGNLAISVSNRTRVGNSSMASIGGQVGWTTVSDARAKKEVQANVPGLSFINALRPVTYNYDKNKEDELMGVKDSSDYRDKYAIEKIRFSGFLAQDVEKAAKKIGYEFSGVDKMPFKGDYLYGLRYAEFVVPLVKAVQELSEENVKQNTQDARHKSEIEELKSRIEKLESLLSDKSSSTHQFINSTTSLEQNAPNPFNSQTEIKFQLPSIFSSAQLIITDGNGKQVRSDVLKSSSSVIIKASELSAGTYSYSLIIDEVTVDSKQMVLTK